MTDTTSPNDPPAPGRRDVALDRLRTLRRPLPDQPQSIDSLRTAVPALPPGEPLPEAALDPPARHLSGWKAILVAPGRPAGDEAGRRVSSLHKLNGGPVILTAGRVGQTDLIQGWNGPQARCDGSRRREADRRATASHRRGQDALVDPGIAGGLHRRRPA